MTLNAQTGCGPGGTVPVTDRRRTGVNELQEEDTDLPPARSQVSRATHVVIRDVQRTDTADRAQRRREQLPAGADASAGWC